MTAAGPGDTPGLVPSEHMAAQVDVRARELAAKDGYVVTAAPRHVATMQNARVEDPKNGETVFESLTVYRWEYEVDYD